MPTRKHAMTLILALTTVAPPAASAQTASAPPESSAALVYPDDPALPEGLTLDQVLDAAAAETPAGYPDPVMDNHPYGFLLVDRLEWRQTENGTDAVQWDLNGWYGGDYDKLWIKSEGEAAFDGGDTGEAEHDLLYAKLVAPFWYAQAGVQLAQEWEDGDIDDRWSLAAAFQGVAPGQFEVDLSLYLSEDADLTAAFEAEYDLRITQRLVLQPRVEMGFAAQDVPERALGEGFTGADLDLRLRYEIDRKFAPYVGVRYGFLSGDTADFADASGSSTEAWSGLFGVRLAF